jgi:acyl-CoA synthetase (NDP forming)
MLAEAIGAGRTELSEIESKRILDALGIPVAAAHLARNADEAAELAARVGFPAALKVLSPQAVHKSEVGGVELALGSPAEVRAAFERIRQNLAARRPDARFDGVAVQAMAPPGIELIVGVARDDFAPLEPPRENGDEGS